MWAARYFSLFNLANVTTCAIGVELSHTEHIRAVNIWQDVQESLFFTDLMYSLLHDDECQVLASRCSGQRFFRCYSSVLTYHLFASLQNFTEALNITIMDNYQCHKKLQVVGALTDFPFF